MICKLSRETVDDLVRLRKYFADHEDIDEAKPILTTLEDTINYLLEKWYSDEAYGRETHDRREWVINTFPRLNASKELWIYDIDDHGGDEAFR